MSRYSDFRSDPRESGEIREDDRDRYERRSYDRDERDYRHDRHDRERGRDWDNHRDRYAERDYEQGEYHHADDYDRHNKGRDRRERWREDDEEPPNTTLILRGLNENTTEDAIGDFVKRTTPISAVRLMRDKVTGESRRFAFVTFLSQDDATYYLESNKHFITLDRAQVRMDYGRAEHLPRAQQAPRPQDWICSVCQFKNFAKRSACHNCQSVYVDANGMTDPWRRGRRTTKLVVQNFNARKMTKDDIIGELTPFQRPLQDVRIENNTCLVEFYNISDASYVQQKCPFIFVKGEKLEVTSLYLEDAPTANAAYQYQAQAVETAKQPRPPYPSVVPPVVDLRFDENTNYYYDGVTGYYYDNNTGYYYDGATGFYYTFDPLSYIFVVVNPSAPPTAAIQHQYPESEKPAEKMEVETKSDAPAPTKKKKTVIVSSAPSTVGTTSTTTRVIQAAPSVTTSTTSATQSTTAATQLVLAASAATSPASIVSHAPPIIPTAPIPQSPTANPSTNSPIAMPATISDPFASSAGASSNTSPASSPLPEPILKRVDGFAVPIGKPSKKVTFSLSTPTPPERRPTNSSPEKSPSNTSNNNRAANNSNLGSSTAKDKYPTLPGADATADSLLAKPSQPQTIEELMGRITKRNFCLLCKKKFDNDIHLERHCTLSDLHRSNLKLKRAEAQRTIRSQQPKKVFPKKRKDSDRTSVKSTSDSSATGTGALGLAYLLPEEPSPPQQHNQNLNTSPLLGYSPSPYASNVAPQYAHPHPVEELVVDNSYNNYRKNFQNNVRQTMRNRFNDIQAAEGK